MTRYFLALLFLTAYATPLPVALYGLKPAIFGIGLALLILLLAKDGFLWRPYRPAVIAGAGAIVLIALSAVRGYFPTPASSEYVLATAAVFVIAPFMRVSSHRDLRDLVRAIGGLAGMWLILLLVTEAVDGSVFGDLKYDTGTLVKGYQMHSLIFGLCAVILFSMARKNNNIFVYAMGAGCIIVSFSMGARGESFFAAFVCAAMLRRWLAIFLFVVAVLVWAFFPTVVDQVLGIRAIKRVYDSLETANYGMRDKLFLMSAELLLNDVITFVFGGGANVFQLTYDLPHGLYPHNNILEAMTTFGVFIGLYYSYLILQHVLHFIRNMSSPMYGHEYLALSAVLIYIILVMLKSGSVWSSWLLHFLVVVHPQTRFWFGGNWEGKRSGVRTRESRFGDAAHEGW